MRRSSCAYSRSWPTRIIVETVGAGQADVEIVQIAHTTVVVSVPGVGDDFQAIKAGLLEVADAHVVNKADRPGADRTAAELASMLTLGAHQRAGSWPVPVLRTVGVTGHGVSALAGTLGRHRAWMERSGELNRRDRATTVARIRLIASEMVLAPIHDPTGGAGFDAVVDDVVAQRLDPYAAADALIRGAALQRPRRHSSKGATLEPLKTS